YVGTRESDAVRNIRSIGLKAQVIRQSNPDPKFPETYVFRQSPQPGERTQKGNFVTIYVSTGPPKTTVPSFVGEPVDRALSQLQDKQLKGRVVRVDSNKPQGIVVSQSPTAGATAEEGSKVILRVSKGPVPIGVPNVISMPFDTASSTLLGAGFAVARIDVDANDPKGTVVGQDPAPDTLQPPGTKITLSVSKGPTTSTVPTVTSLSQRDAIAQLRTSGFRVKVVPQEVSDPNQEGIVQTQDPAGGSVAPPGTRVT